MLNILTIPPTKFLLRLVYVDFLAVVLAIGLGFALHQSPTAYTGEGEPITWLSFAHLLVTSTLAWEVFSRRTGGSLRGNVWRSPTFVWLLIALGFLFLAIDEIVAIHESFDHLLHRTFQIQETGLTDRLDDVIMLGYGLIGVGALYAYRGELVRYQSALPLVICGFVLFVLMGLLDALVNRDDVFLFLGIGKEGSHALAMWIGGVEEGLKILAEAALLGATYTCVFLTQENGKASHSGADAHEDDEDGRCD